MPTWQGEEFLERVLRALAGQVCPIPWDFLAIDSGSTDRTLAILREFQADFPVQLSIASIHKTQFDHGDTRNLLVARSKGELCVFLTQDAIPVGETFLADLARNFEDPGVAAATCRNLARPDAELLTKVFSEKDPGYTAGRREVRLPDAATYAAMNAHERRLLYNFNDVASAVRRGIWEHHPFPRTEFGEDVLMARALLEAGHTVVYDDRACVEHSHDYSPQEMLSRAKIDGKFNAEWLDRICVGSRSDADVLVQRQLVLDREALESAGLDGAQVQAQLRLAKDLRRAAFVGMYEGGVTRTRQAATAVLRSPLLRILYVVHGFPPDTQAGTEIYTLNLAREMQRRGHEVAILTRAPAAKSEAEGGPADFSLRAERYRGEDWPVGESLAVWRMTHRLEHRRLRDSFDQPRARAPFLEVVASFRPDLVHFQHLIHLSAGLVREAVELGLATVVHCHDLWPVCARVQAIRPDGVRCEENMGAGCYLCVKEKWLEHIPVAKAAGGLLGPVGALLASAAGQGEYSDLMARQEFLLDAWSAADLRISPSRFVRSKLLATGAFDPARSLFSENGIRQDQLHRLSKRPDPEGRVRFGFIGSLVWYKGGEVMLQAMAELAGTRAVLNVFGDFSPDSDAHHAKLRDLARGSAVHFRGRFDNSKLSEVYTEIDVLIVPSIWFENAPITIQEAFLAGTPVVTSNIGGMAEYVRDGVDGLHFQVGDAHDLARCLRRFLDEPRLVEQLSRDFPRIKSVEEDAAEMEFRYRGLVARRRVAKPRTWIDCRGVDASRREGSVDPQGADMLLLRPENGAIEFDLASAAGGKREIEVQVFGLAGEKRVELGGRVLIDQEEIGRIAPFSSAGKEGVVSFVFQANVPRSARSLRLESRTAAGARSVFLRVQRVIVRDPRPAVATSPSNGSRAP
ncbi:MAG: glycosyltransferase, partial [Planctomycetota bacterium]